jgi:multicomponent Na+:H+ antiporter subunit C
MEIILAVVIGSLYAGGIYMLLRRNSIKAVLGLTMLGYGTNLLIFTLGTLTRGAPPVIPSGQDVPVTPVADPLPQALILTAIVIGFGVQAFALVLVKRVYATSGTSDVSKLTSTTET